MEQIIERLKMATGPDREIDCLIFESQHKLLTPERRGTYYGEPTGEYFGLNGEQLPERAPTYTASIDAALTLVPENWRVAKLEDLLAGRWIAELIEIHSQDGIHYRSEEGAGRFGNLALCIAALKARSSINAS